MGELYNCILTRRSVRSFEDKPVDFELLEKIVCAGYYAPSGKNRQPWHFIIVDDTDKVHRMAPLCSTYGPFEKAASAVLVCAEPAKCHGEGNWPADCSAATENILLAAHDIGLGCCWCAVYPYDDRIEAVREMYEIPDNIIPISAIAIGWPGEEPAAPPRKLIGKIHLNSWDNVKE